MTRQRGAALLMTGALAALGIVAPVPLAAQDTTVVAPGDHVRVLAPDLGRYGWSATFVALRGDSVWLRGSGADSAAVGLPVNKIVRLDVNHGNRPPGNEALPGLIFGALAGLGVGLITAEACKDVCGGSYAEITLVSTAAFGVIGLGIGALQHAAEPFDRVWLTPQVGVVALPGARMGVGVQLRP